MYYKDFVKMARIVRKQESCQNGKKQESYQKSKKTRIMQELQEHKNQTRIQEHKNLAWRDISCLSSQDSVYKNLVRKSRSVFPGKNLVYKGRQKNLVWKSRKTRIWTERRQDRRLVYNMIYSTIYFNSYRTFNKKFE